jgi:hypothetical protein
MAFSSYEVRKIRPVSTSSAYVLLKHFIASDLSMALLEVRKLPVLVLMFLAIIASLEWSVSAKKRLILICAASRLRREPLSYH